MPHKKVFYTEAGYRFLHNPIIEHFLEVRDVLEVMMWIDTCVCLPLTILMVYCVCCVVRRSPVPVIYYTNLLTSNLIQLCIMIVWILRISSIIPAVIHLLCVMASLYFRMCIALERCFHITYPLLDCLRQTRSSVLVCVLVWAFCIVSVPLAIVLHELERLIIYTALPGPLFIFCLARTFRGLPAATSVPTEETRRSLGLLILLFFSYFLIVVPTIICDIYGHSSIVSFISFLLSPFVDLILFLFMWKGRIDKLLTCMCSSDVRPDHQCGLG